MATTKTDTLLGQMDKLATASSKWRINVADATGSLIGATGVVKSLTEMFERWNEGFKKGPVTPLEQAESIVEQFRGEVELRSAGGAIDAARKRLEDDNYGFWLSPHRRESDKKLVEDYEAAVKNLSEAEEKLMEIRKSAAKLTEEEAGTLYPVTIAPIQAAEIFETTIGGEMRSRFADLAEQESMAAFRGFEPSNVDQSAINAILDDHNLFWNELSKTYLTLSEEELEKRKESLERIQDLTDEFQDRFQRGFGTLFNELLDEEENFATNFKQGMKFASSGCRLCAYRGTGIRASC